MVALAVLLAVGAGTIGGVFLGTALLSLAVMVRYVVAARDPGAGWLLAGALIYLLGSFAVTMRCNVPRNERLARLNADTAEAAAYWLTYVREWTAWNHVRTCACLAAAVCAGMATASS